MTTYRRGFSRHGTESVAYASDATVREELIRSGPDDLTPSRLSRSLLVVLLVFLGPVVGCGGSSVGPAEVLFRCPSPNGSRVAIHWVRTGGGAAGWVEYVLTVLPAGQPPETLAERYDEPLLHSAHFRRARTLDLSWEAERVLSVGFPESAVVLQANPGGIYTHETPDLQLRYRSLPANGAGDLAGGSACSSVAPSKR